MKFRIPTKFSKKFSLRKRLERIYDKLYERADKLVQQTKPCQVRIENGDAICLGCRINSEFIPKNVLCCEGCPFHDPKKGCTAEKPLACKLWLCGSVTSSFHNPLHHKKVRILGKRLMNLKDIAASLGLYVPRGDKKAHIDAAMSSMRNQFIFSLLMGSKSDVSMDI